MTVPRHSLGAAAGGCPPGQTGICVYAVGGYSNGFSGAAESYNPATNARSPVASIPTPRANAGVAATTCPPGQSGTCVYVAGGNRADILANVDSYNPATNAWTALPSLPRPRNQLAAAAVQCPPGINGTCVYAPVDTSAGPQPGHLRHLRHLRSPRPSTSLRKLRMPAPPGSVVQVGRSTEQAGIGPVRPGGRAARERGWARLRTYEAAPPHASVAEPFESRLSSIRFALGEKPNGAVATSGAQEAKFLAQSVCSLSICSRARAGADGVWWTVGG
ncbi:hypothetical protein ACWGN5_26655 [Streptomyces sp. NPDC055815]